MNENKIQQIVQAVKSVSIVGSGFNGAVPSARFARDPSPKNPSLRLDFSTLPQGEG